MWGCRSCFEPRHSTGTGEGPHRSEANQQAAGHSRDPSAGALDATNKPQRVTRTQPSGQYVRLGIVHRTHRAAWDGRGGGRESAGASPREPSLRRRRAGRQSEYAPHSRRTGRPLGPLFCDARYGAPPRVFCAAEGRNMQARANPIWSAPIVRPLGVVFYLRGLVGA